MFSNGRLVLSLLLLLFVFAGGYLLPRDVVVARTVEIVAPPSDVFPYVNSVKPKAAVEQQRDVTAGLKTVNYT